MVPLSAVLTGVIALLLMRQPNLGETVIFVSAWIVLLMLSGAPMRILYVLGAAGVGLLVTRLSLLRRGDAADRRLPVRRRATNIRSNRRCGR